MKEGKKKKETWISLKKKKAPTNQRTTDINKSLPVRYFTLARALSSASKYHTVIAYLGKGFKKKIFKIPEP